MLPQVSVPGIAEDLGVSGLSFRYFAALPPLGLLVSVGDSGGLPCAEFGAWSLRGSTPPPPHRLCPSSDAPLSYLTHNLFSRGEAWSNWCDV